ncbi:MAG: hypothetical protein IJG68_04295 [Bacilli bacterium]|nr:hypothetical protein [Bacilli bacterium]
MNKKNVLLYILFFVATLFWCLFIRLLNLDEVWNYGFSHNLYMGLIPYKDFNMVVTPLFPFMMSLGFYLFGSNILIFHIENAIIMTILLWMMIKLLGEKAWLVMLFLFVPINISIPNYNVFIFFLLIVLLLMEKNESNDYLIGFVIGLSILTKQSVGLCMVLPSLYYIKNSKKIVKRVIGILIPISIFVLYLLLTNSFSDFINLCFFGLFDFASENRVRFNLYYLIFVVFLMIYIVIIRKNKQNILNYYCLSFTSMMIPIFDPNHTQVTFLALIVFLILNNKMNLKLKYPLLFFGTIVGVSCVIMINYSTRIIYPNTINHFEYRLLNRDYIQFIEKVNEYTENHKDKEIIYLNSDGYFFKLINDQRIGYIDLINQGNWGYRGSEKLYKEIKKKKDAIFFVNESELTEKSQADKKIQHYVLDNGKKIGKIDIYDIYVIE